MHCILQENVQYAAVLVREIFSKFWLNDLVYLISKLPRPLYFPTDNYRKWCKLNFGPWHGSGEL